MSTKEKTNGNSKDQNKEKTNGNGEHSSDAHRKKTNGDGDHIDFQDVDYVKKTNGDGEHSYVQGLTFVKKTNGDSKHGSSGGIKVKTNGDGKHGKTNGNGDNHHESTEPDSGDDDDTAETPLFRRTVRRDSDSSEEGHGTIRKHRYSTGASLVRRDKSPKKTFTVSEGTGGNDDKVPLRTKAKKAQRPLFVRIAGATLVMITIVLLVVVIYLATRGPELQFCEFDDSYIQPRNLEKPGVFDDITPSEYSAVYDFILGNKSMGVKNFDEATVDSSYILLIELMLPDKKDVIQYLDKKGKRPIRKAKIVIIRGDYSIPCVEEYIVSPLNKPTSIVKYKNPSFKKDTIPYSSRPIDLIEYKYLFDGILKTITEQMYPLLMESFGRCYHNCTKGVNCIEIFDIAPRGTKSGERKSWFWMFASVDGFYIHPLGAELLINHVSTDIFDWAVEKVVFNGQKFDTVDQLMTAYYSKKLIVPYVPNDKETIEYSYYDVKEPLAFKPVQGPKFVEPEGKRFSVTGQRINYRGWQFHYTMFPSSGMRIFDIRFEGKRIAYEISLQEVLVLYTGYGPTQSATMYYDVSWLLGAQTMGLVRGVDCPDTAVYMDTHFLANSGKTQMFKDNVCIFEQTTGMPIRRHYGNDFYGSYSFYGGLTDYRLVVRTIANVLNYDYLFDYIFHSNGAVEMKLSATGYVQATFLLKEERAFGSPIHNQVMADLHHHLFNYKIDLDVVGERNRYAVLEIGTQTIDDPWIDGVKKTQEVIKRKEIKKESKEGTFNNNVPQYHLIYNPAAKNKFGSHRAYRIYNKGPTQFLMVNASVTASAQWAKYPIMVTERKEAEQTSTSIYAQNDPWTPMVDFDDFVDGDSLEDQDLVAWVTMGVHHIPGTEDVPSTPTTWNQYSVFVQPHNYFDICPTTKLPDNVVIRPNTDGPIVKTHGRSFESTCIPKSVGPFEYEGDLIPV